MHTGRFFVPRPASTITVLVTISFLICGSLPRVENVLSDRVLADSTPQTLPFSQNWSNTGLITTDDNWSGVPGIVGFRGDDLTTVTATDPQTILADGSGTPVDVIANQLNPNALATGGVAEFDGIANPVVALQGSGTADAPHLVISINTTGFSGIVVAYNLRDVDGSADNAVEPVALQFRVGASGNYTNIPAGFVADATTGPNLATLVTPVSVTLPAAANNQPLVQIRIITTNAIGNDEWVGIDDLLIFVPSAATVESFGANDYQGNQVLLSWRTGFEVDNLGFNVYREQNGKRTLLNHDLIAGSALMVGEGTSLRSGYVYSWIDKGRSQKGAQYWLETVDLSGQKKLFGPAIADHSTGSRALPHQGSRMLLQSVGLESSAGSAPVPCTGHLNQSPDSRLFHAKHLTGIKISVAEEGWYRLSQPDLIAAGLDPSIDPRLLHLYAEGVEQSITIVGEEDGRLDRADSIQFYGMGLESPYSNQRVYWLALGDQPGARIDSPKAKGSEAAPDSFDYAIERRDRTVYFSSLRNGDAENFFGAVISRAPVDQRLTARHVALGSDQSGLLEVTLQGVTANEHRVTVQCNGAKVGEVTFSALGNTTASFKVPSIREGENVVSLQSQTAGDVSLVDSIRLRYRHKYTADEGFLRFTSPGKRVVTIDGFTQPEIAVMDVTDPASPLALRARVEPQGSGFTAVIKTPKGSNRELIAFTPDQIKRPQHMLADRDSNLKDPSREADLLIITRPSFFSALEPLITLRSNQGLAVSVVDATDIYDEFSYGEKSPESIRSFLAYARTTWAKPPRFVLIVGDASLDPKNHLGVGDFDLVPTKLIDTVLMESASDDWLVDFDGDGFGEIPIGRLPIRTPEEASLIVGKIVAREQAPEPHVLLVSDQNDGIDFEAGTGRLRQLIPDGVPVSEIVRGKLDDAATKMQLLDHLRSGYGVVSYFGHGSLNLWRGAIFNSSDTNQLNVGGRGSLYLLITCLNGYFQDPSVESLAESLLKVEGGGAAAVWASSGMCGPDEQLAMNLEVIRSMFGGSHDETLGTAFWKARAGATDPDVRRTYLLFGDPSARLR
jgi:hypothetical protein